MFHDEEDIYEFIPSSTKSKYHSVGIRDCLGTIDADGNFRPNLSDLEKMINAFKRKLPRSRMGPSNLIERKHTKEKVYENRSGILVPMVFDEYRGLIPEVGGKIIDFKDYRYSPEARRIYNLPGRFVRIVR
ncbi:MAG: hypothetical protein JNJ77_21730 [Planctomycetia bacterium]|nr:hypothetical protein [Planctomycetia bacterium]